MDELSESLLLFLFYIYGFINDKDRLSKTAISEQSSNLITDYGEDSVPKRCRYPVDNIRFINIASRHVEKSDVFNKKSTACEPTCSGVMNNLRRFSFTTAKCEFKLDPCRGIYYESCIVLFIGLLNLMYNEMISIGILI